MVQIIVDEQRLLLKFTYTGLDCLEDIGFPASEKNLALANRLRAALEQQIQAGTFRYQKTFPSSQVARMLSLLDSGPSASATPTFEDYANRWFAGRRIEWRQTYADTTRLTLNKYLIPTFGSKVLDAITKDDLLVFRTSLGGQPGIAAGSTLSANRINKIMLPLRMVLVDAADQFGFPCPWRGIKSIHEPRGRVDPLTLSQVERFLTVVRPDFRSYFKIRFLTGLRSSEVNGLTWSAVDLAAAKVHVHQALVNGQLVPTKNDMSDRVVTLTGRAVEALEASKGIQQRPEGLVFRGRRGGPLNNAWLTNHVWYPALRSAGMSRRRPYQTRHTAATLWLAAGENPQWIANQLGHTTTEMLFRIYARYVPNTLRRDGSLIESYLSQSRLEGGQVF